MTHEQWLGSTCPVSPFPPRPRRRALATGRVRRREAILLRPAPHQPHRAFWPPPATAIADSCLGTLRLGRRPRQVWTLERYGGSVRGSKAPLAHGAAGCQTLGVPGCRRDRGPWRTMVGVLPLAAELLTPVRVLPRHAGGPNAKLLSALAVGAGASRAAEEGVLETPASFIFFLPNAGHGCSRLGWPDGRRIDKSECVAVGDLAHAHDMFGYGLSAYSTWKELGWEVAASYILLPLKPSEH